ncbi:MAG: pyrroline-5-carboxylate reductase family protein, partial [Halobacteriales archaeon]
MKVTVIGCGNLGSAVVEGLVNVGHDVVACDKDEGALAALSDGVEKTAESTEAVEGADLIIIAVKPEVVGPVLESFEAGEDQVVASFAAAVSLGYVRERTDAGAVRVMPNLAGEYNEMAAAVCPEGDVPNEVTRALDDLGDYVEVNEELMDIATAVNGSGPAFVFYAMKAMRDAGVDG